MANAVLETNRPVTQRDIQWASLWALAELCRHHGTEKARHLASTLSAALDAYDEHKARPALEPALWRTCQLAERALRQVVLGTGYTGV